MDGNINRSVTLDEENPEGQKTGRFVSMVTPDVENPAAKKMSREDGESSKSKSSRGLTFIEKIRIVRREPYRTIWGRIFVISCIFAVYLDPFFFYVVIIDEDKKCLQMDKTLSIVACLMRSLTDVIFLVHLICTICDAVQNPKPKTLKKRASSVVGQTRGSSENKPKIRELIDQVTLKKVHQKMPWLSVFTVIDFFALIPLPQLLVVVMFYTMKGSRFVENKKVLSFFLLCQYFPRVWRIYLSAKEFERTNGIWAKGLYNLFLYILASHVLGAFWYFFSILRELTCWHEACVNHSKDPKGCINTFYCGSGSTTARNIKFLNEHCMLDTQNSALFPFNFGIFLDSLKNQNTEHIKFGTKFFYSFWWGLRNLSNFGTNLTTSTYVWENLFAILISFVGLLLFLYLIGNVQTFMQMKTTKTEEMRQKISTKTEEMRQKIKLKKLDVKTWMYRNGLPQEIRDEILSSIKQTLKQHIDADLHNLLFSILPVETRRSLKRCLCLKTLTEVKKLQDMNEEVLTLMCEHLKPVRYIENSFVFRMGDPVDYMLFIIEGTVWIYESSDSQTGKGISSMDTKRLGKGHFYGEELLDCASDSFTKLPVSSKYVKCQTKVEAFVLMANDLETVVSTYPLLWRKSEECSQKEENIAASTIAKVYRHHLRDRQSLSGSKRR